MVFGVKEWLQSKRPTVIYGAGHQGSIFYGFCKMYRKPCAAIMTSGSKSRWGGLPGEEVIPHATPQTFSGNRSDVDVVVAVGGDVTGIAGNLRQCGYPRIFVSADWNEDNEWLLRNFYESYMRSGGTDLDSQGQPYWRYEDGDTCFKIYYPVDKIYDSALLGDAGNILLPSVFHDDSCIAFGPYELPGAVEIKKGDVVLDLGAGIGDYAAVAAAKGGTVYAVEPNPHGPLPYLKMNASLYPDRITVIPKAIYDKSGQMDLFYNSHLEDDHDITRATLNPAAFEEYATEKVDAVTLDELVKEQRLERVDIVKSSIPGSEILWRICTLGGWKYHRSQY